MISSLDADSGIMQTFSRGSMSSSIVRFPSIGVFRMICSCVVVICSASRAMVASAVISPILIFSSFLSFLCGSNGRLIRCTNAISGLISQTRNLSVRAVYAITGKLKRTPSVFGRISVY